MHVYRRDYTVFYILRSNFHQFSSQSCYIFMYLSQKAWKGKKIVRYNRIKFKLLEKINTYSNTVFLNYLTLKKASINLIIFFFLKKLSLPLRYHMICLLWKIFSNFCRTTCNYRSQFLRYQKEFVGNVKHRCWLVTVCSSLLS